MKAFFEAIQSLFVDFLFKPLDFLRHFEQTSWSFSNLMSWFFMGVCAYYIVYWCKQLTLHNQDQTNDQDTTAHSFLGNNFLK